MAFTIQQENEDARDDGELFLYKEIKVDPGQGLLRIDKFLFDRLEGISRSKIQISCTAGLILVNGDIVKPNYKVHPNDEIKIFTHQQNDPTIIIPENIPIDIVYEDDYVMIVNKKPGMVVHPGVGNLNGTLINAVAYHWKKSDEELWRIGLVHRIDKGTSGLLCFGKDEQSAFFLSEQFRLKTAKRKYVALVWGDVELDEGTVDKPLGRNKNHRKQYEAYEKGTENTKEAITHYKVLERFGYTTLIECRLETGRTHQIRVHMKSIGHPIFNDFLYGGDKIVKGTVFAKYRQFVDNCFAFCNRQALHAKTLGFVHPHTKKEIFFDSDIPIDMEDVIDKWRRYAKGKYEV